MGMPDKMETDGFAIIPGLISQALVAPAVKAIKERVNVALKGYNIEPGPDFVGLIHASASLHKTPAQWPGIRFGGHNMRGWMRSSGTGRIFDDWNDPSVVAVQEACRGLAAALLQVPPESLHRVHERCSAKVPGCPEFGAHLDRNLENTIQIIIALSDTKFLLWPGSHQHDIGSDAHGFYPLSRAEIQALPQPRSVVDAGAGDVCVMRGGKLVHGSVAVTSGVRIMTYAHFETSLAQGQTVSHAAAIAETTALPKKRKGRGAKRRVPRLSKKEMPDPGLPEARRSGQDIA